MSKELFQFLLFRLRLVKCFYCIYFVEFSLSVEMEILLIYSRYFTIFNEVKCKMLAWLVADLMMFMKIRSTNKWFDTSR